ncbi:carboxypeptidase-like regulatory domain-containing protein [Patescibacteria group bacterium]|nr:carboxypeptidase-like regulatory domain-containing protein [Patescibacteria group bacterium]
MKRIFFIVVAVALLLGGGYFLFNKTEASFDDNVSGWGWSSNIGWTSMNDVNQKTSLHKYGLDIDASGNLTGYAWLGNDQDGVTQGGGWLVFGSTIKDDAVGIPAIHQKPGGLPGDALSLIPANLAPDGTIVSAKINSDNTITGWARFLNLWDYGHNVFDKNDWGWVKLSGFAQNGDKYGLELDPDNRDINGYAWSGGGTSGTTYHPEAGYGWLHFSAVGVDTVKLEGVVCKNIDNTPTCGDSPAEEPLAQATVVASTGGYRTTTAETPIKGYYQFSNLKIDAQTGKYEADVTVTKEGCKPLTQAVSIEPIVNPIVRVDFPLECGAVAEGEAMIKGTVLDDINNNNLYDFAGPTADLRIAGAMVYTDEGHTTFTDSAGNYTLSKLEEKDYNINIVISGYSLKDRSQANPVQAVMGAGTELNFLMERSEDYKTKANLSWVQTMQGDIHSAEGSVQPLAKPPRGYANATYVISADNNVERVRSWAQDYSSDEQTRKQEWEIENYSGPLPQSFMANINLNELETKADYTIPNFETTKQPSDFVNSGIYFKDGDLELQGGYFAQGARTIVVGGDLIITGDLAYQAGAFSKDNLPSVGIVVGGDITIRDDVRRIVGNYFSRGVTRFRDGSGDANIRLINEGLMIANNFEFLRDITHDQEADQYKKLVEITAGYFIDNSYADPEILHQNNIIHFDADEFESPSLLIFYDGRVIINTPPGFEDISTKLPKVWEEIPAP